MGAYHPSFGCPTSEPPPLTFGETQYCGLAFSGDKGAAQIQSQSLSNISQNSESGIRPQKAETVENVAIVRDSGASSRNAQPHSSHGQSF